MHHESRLLGPYVSAGQLLHNVMDVPFLYKNISPSRFSGGYESLIHECGYSLAKEIFI